MTKPTPLQDTYRENRSVMAAAVHELRQDAELTQADLAQRAGCARENIARIETGKHYPKLNTIKRIEKACLAALKEHQTG